MATHTVVKAEAGYVEQAQADEERIRIILDTEVIRISKSCSSDGCSLVASGCVGYQYGDAYYRMEAQCKPSCEGCGERIMGLIGSLDRLLTESGILSEGDDEMSRLQVMPTEDTGSPVNEYQTSF